MYRKIVGLWQLDDQWGRFRRLRGIVAGLWSRLVLMMACELMVIGK